MKQVLIKKGQAIVAEIPSPMVDKNESLVQVYYSCISTGTEIFGLRSAGEPLYKKALKQPQDVKRVLQMLRDQGLSKTVSYVKGVLNSGSPTGYSASGIILEVGQGITDLKPGDKVACAGAGIANHAEFIAVPRNLTAKLPDNLPLDLASTITLGAIAMQGVRRADPKLGELVAVIGLGILGQLTAQMLKIAGSRVIGVDLEQERIDAALSLGMDWGLNPGRDNIVPDVIRFSGGYGVDSVILTAATESSELINQAMEMCRKKGRVVIVGAVGLNLKREDFYRKELDVLISTSYGPGRYDERYEQKGDDYPYAYVRWTENRNMQEYLRLLQEQRLNIKPLIEGVYSIEKATQCYAELNKSSRKSLITLLMYNQESGLSKRIVVSKPRISQDKLKVALIGAGSFARAMHLPNLQRLSHLYQIYAISSKTGTNALSIAKQYGAAYATTDFKKILTDKNVDLVMIATRHNLHSQMAIEAIRAGKAVFVEKPMALNREELKELVQTLEETSLPFMVGFNRRFSPYSQRIKWIIDKRLNPMIINYRMNAGFTPREHWVQTDEGGGRNIGEACHIYDLFNFFTDSGVKSVSASSISPKTEQYLSNDNFVATIRYEDGSVCNLIYTALGTKEVSKEQMEIYVDAKIIHLDDYKKLTISGAKITGLETKIQQKGQYEELLEFAKKIKEGQGYPIPLWQLIQATEISFKIEEQCVG